MKVKFFLFFLCSSLFFGCVSTKQSAKCLACLAECTGAINWKSLWGKNGTRKVYFQKKTISRGRNKSKGIRICYDKKTYNSVKHLAGRMAHKQKRGKRKQ